MVRSREQDKEENRSKDVAMISPLGVLYSSLPLLIQAKVQQCHNFEFSSSPPSPPPLSLSLSQQTGALAATATSARYKTMPHWGPTPAKQIFQLPPTAVVAATFEQLLKALEFSLTSLIEYVFRTLICPIQILLRVDHLLAQVL